jgi:hypothetical protein
MKIRHEISAAGLLLGWASTPLLACCGWSDGFEGSGALAGMSMTPTQVSIAQDSSATASLSFDCGTAVGPIEVQLESPPPGVKVTRQGIGHCGSPATVSLHSSGATPPGTHPINIGARPSGGQWFVTPIWLIVDAGARFLGDFTTADGMGGFTTWGYSATGDRCEWVVIWEGTIEIVFTDTTPHYVDHPKTNSFTLTGTRRSIAVDEQVGDTLCATTTKTFSATEMFQSGWPGLDVMMRLQTASQPTIGHDVLTFHGVYQPNWREMVIWIEFGFDRPDAGGQGDNIDNRIPRVD